MSRATGVLARVKHYLPKRVLFTIYNSLCLSHMSYAITVWGAAPPSTLDRLVILHKKGIRHVCGSKYNAHTDPLYLKMNTLKLTDLFRLNCVKLMFKKCHGTLHKYHSERLGTKFELGTTQTRQKHDIIIKERNANSSINSINVKVGTVWNRLAFEIKDSKFKSIGTFNKHIKKSYISLYNTECNDKHCYVCNL